MVSSTCLMWFLSIMPTHIKGRAIKLLNCHISGSKRSSL
uniref:Uncharacterized protein n=1 Tax=Arundo donax TaxID=35708 RepID=A0A0A9H7V6_ARUDO